MSSYWDTNSLMNGMTRRERIAAGYPPDHLAPDEIAGYRAADLLKKTNRDKIALPADRFTPEEEQALNRQNTSLQIKSEADWTRSRLNKYIDDWTDLDKKMAREKWIKDYSSLSRQEKYRSLMQNISLPWTMINNCVEHGPINPDDPNITGYDKDMYYNFTIADCGATWEWYNSVGVNLGDAIQRVKAGWKFFGSAYANRDIALEKGMKALGNAGEAVKVPYYFTVVAGVIGLIALAVLKVG